jgi:hypothetical protein
MYLSRPEITTIAPDLFYYSWWENSGLATIVAKVANGQLIKMSEDKYKEAFVHQDDNTPLKEFPVAHIRHTRAASVGRAFGIAYKRWRMYRERCKVVRFENGMWYALGDLPERYDGFNDAWICSDKGLFRFLVVVDGDGYVHLQRSDGSGLDQPVTSAQETTSLNLIKVWGVGPEKYWVMDRSGTIWERTATESRVVVRGMYRDDVNFVDAWVSPMGTVIALTDKQVYRLD